MNRPGLKAIGLTVVILAVIVGVWYFQPGESPSAEQIAKQERPASRAKDNPAEHKTTADRPGPIAARTSTRPTSPAIAEFQKHKAAQLNEPG